MLSKDNALILREIKTIDARIRQLGEDPDVCARWKTSGGPFQATLGADVEYPTYHRRLKRKPKIPSRANCVENKLIEAAYAACGNNLCAAPTIDGRSLELNLRPGSGAELVETYLSVGKKIVPVADRLGWTISPGSAMHTHISVRDTGVADEKKGHLMNDEGVWGMYSAFSEMLTGNVLALQCVVPALYFCPNRSEKKPAEVITKYIGFRYGSFRACTVRMNEARYPNKALMYEIRSANLPPFAPALLALHAIERTLLGQTIRNDYTEKDVSLRANSCFVRGAGCHFDDLRTTREAGYLKRHFPHLEPILMRQCEDGYKFFLENPAYSPMYSDAERTALLARLAGDDQALPLSPKSVPLQFCKAIRGIRPSAG